MTNGHECRVVTACRAMFGLLVVVFGGLCAGCASTSELVTVRNDSGSALQVAVVFGIRSGLAPTGLIAGPGARTFVLCSSDTWIASATSGGPLIPINSPLSATVVMVRPVSSEWSAFIVEWSDRAARQRAGVHELHCSIKSDCAAYKVVALNQSGLPLVVTAVRPSTKGDAAEMVRRWKTQLP